MKIRTRLALWCSGLVLFCLLLMLGVLYYELVLERLEGGRPEETPEKIREILLMYGLPSAIVFITGAWWFASRALDPVARLTEAVERIQADNLTVRLPRTGNGDELDRLTAVFDDMMSRLQGSFERIREFTLAASHELKTPLTIMRGEVETLLRSETCTQEQREVLADHLGEIDRLSRIVDNLSLLARADAGLIQLEQEDLSLAELMQEAYEDGCVLAEAQPRQVEVILATCHDVRLKGDRHRLRQVLLNLVDNAVKYNQPHGRVLLEARRQPGEVVIRIANTGPGIPQDQCARIFDRFHRGPRALEERIEGSGLGLSIAQSLVQAHGGTIELQSSPGALTTVSVHLPLPA